jgi:heme exporter protein B
MLLFKEIGALFHKELLLEWRQKYALNGILLYLASTLFVCYLSFAVKGNQLSVSTWNALFWIIILFTSVNAIAKSFIQERLGRNIYYYTIASPQGIIISKMLYNICLMLVLSLSGFIFYALVLGNPVQDIQLFLLNLLLAGTGFSAVLTLISGIASKASNSSTLMSILSMPILIPMLLLVIKISKNAIDGLSWSVSTNSLLVLVAINVMLGSISYILFPYLWRS